MIRRVMVVLTTMLMTGVLAGWQASTAAADHGRHTYTGEIDGAEYRVEMPADWNGTLLLYSHGYYPEGFPVTGVALTNRGTPFGLPTEDWLLERGYALAASNTRDVTGYHVKQGLRDQIALLDWFEATIGPAERTISTGQSLGAALAVQLADEHPDRFSGVATFCGGYDPLGLWNAVLDITFVVKTLLAGGEDIDLVESDDPETDRQALQLAADRAMATPQGRARLALAASVNNVTGRYSARLPAPNTDEERILQQKEWIKNAYVFLGTVARADIERRAGGNPSWNTGIDYARQLEKSAQTELVEQAYAEAGLDLDTDLDTLAKQPRIEADAGAVEFLQRYGVQSGRTPVPVITVHSTGDGGAVTDQERWYAGQVRRNGDPSKLRQLYVDRGGHCTISAAEEVTAVQALEQRIDTGTWPNLSPGTMNAAAADVDPGLQFVFDFSTFTDAPDLPKFTDFTPPRFLRPSG